jgi:hypothetical protein
VTRLEDWGVAGLVNRRGWSIKVRRRLWPRNRPRKMRCLPAVGWFSSTKSSPAAAATFLNRIFAAGFSERSAPPKARATSSTVRWSMIVKIRSRRLLGSDPPILLDSLFVLQYICFNTNAKASYEWCHIGVGLWWLGHLPKKLNVEEF